jgi:Anti-sigma-K factor rskA
MTPDELDDPLVLDALGRAVPHVDPPRALRARVLAAAVATRQERPGVVAVNPVAAGASPQPISTSSSSRDASSRWPWLLAAASALLAVGASLGWWSASEEVARLRSTVAELRATATTLLAVRADFDRERVARERAANILNAPDVTGTSLAGVAPATTARARVYVSASRGLFFAAENLPPLPTGRTYQLWTIVAGQPVSHGVFDPASSGRADLLAQAPPGPVDAFAVTIEPAGGVPAPTGDKVLLGLPAN